MKLGLILNWTNCQIISEKSGITVTVKMNDGNWLGLQAFPPDLKGMIAAMDVAMNVMSGKFWPDKVITADVPRFEQPKELAAPDTTLVGNLRAAKNAGKL